jgi:hypothetical protein
MRAQLDKYIGGTLELRAQAGPCQQCSSRGAQEAGIQEEQNDKVSQQDPGCYLRKLSTGSCLLCTHFTFPRWPYGTMSGSTRVHRM